MLWIILVSIGLLIIAGLGVYAGKLVFQLQQQNARQKDAREKRLVVMFEPTFRIKFRNKSLGIMCQVHQ
ncbi:MAG: hypothetical protein CBB67_006450 [Alteromonadaceae bacterium TMED7]|nr:hypothetical protein [Alteromonadaceae bacterium]RPH20193.1 MAG: hypothetical protein CBB67_006450 [Alteromonadaceae bacterium TMED7]